MPFRGIRGSRTHTGRLLLEKKGSWQVNFLGGVLGSHADPTFWPKQGNSWPLALPVRAVGPPS